MQNRNNVVWDVTLHAAKCIRPTRLDHDPSPNPAADKGASYEGTYTAHLAPNRRRRRLLSRAIMARYMPTLKPYMVLLHATSSSGELLR